MHTAVRFPFILLLASLTVSTLQAQDGENEKQGFIGVSLGTGQMSAVQYKGTPVESAVASGMVTSHLRLGYFINESLAIESGLMNLAGSARFQRDDTLQVFRLSRTAIPLSVVTYLQRAKAFSPYAKLGGYWVATGRAISLKPGQGGTADLRSSFGVTAAFGLRYRPDAHWSYHLSAEVFQNLGPAKLQTAGFSLQVGLEYALF